MIRNLRFSRELVLLGVLIAIMLVMAQLSPFFFTLGNLLDTSRYFVEIGLIALGMTLIIITAGIDLSVGAGLALVSVAVGFSFAAGLPLPLALILGLLTGLGAGLFNGLFITRLDLHPLVVTLGTFALFRGLAYGLSDADAVSSYPAWFAYFGQAYLGPIPGQLILFVVAVIVAWIVLSRTSFGRYVYAIGSNEEAARLSGIGVGRDKTLVYVLSGATAAAGAIMYCAQFGAAPAIAGEGYELDAIAAVVVGGTSLFGGQGGVIGTFVGALIIGIVGNILNLMGVSPFAQPLAKGALIILAVLIVGRGPRA